MPSTLAIPPSARGVLLFGGTFDPPHRAHIALPRSIRHRLLGRGWWLVYVPAARNPLKSEGPVATDRQRVAMLRAATAGVPRCTIWTDELTRPPPSYWIDTLRRARAALPERVALRFLMGSDSAASFHRWREPRAILALAEPIVMLRPPHTTPAKLMKDLGATGFWTQPELAAWRTRIDGRTLVPLSATDIRSALRTSSRPAKGVPSAVRALMKTTRAYAR